MTERIIYRQSFGTDENFENFLFKASLKTLKSNGETVAQLFLLPCNIVKDGKSFSARYIFAACTEKSHRKQGFMGQLLNNVIKENRDILLLRPAEKDLIGYYKKFGFRIFSACDSENKGFYIEPLDIFKELALSEGITTEGDFPIMALGSPFELDGIYFPFSMP